MYINKVDIKFLLLVLIMVGHLTCRAMASDPQNNDKETAVEMAEHYLDILSESKYKDNINLIAIDTISPGNISQPICPGNMDSSVAWQIKYECSIGVLIPEIFTDSIESERFIIELVIGSSSGSLLKIRVSESNKNKDVYPEYSFTQLENKYKRRGHKILGPSNDPENKGFFSIMQGKRPAYFKELDAYLVSMDYNGISQPLNVWILYFKGIAPSLPKGKGGEKVPLENRIYGLYIYDAETGRLLSFSTAPPH